MLMRRRNQRFNLSILACLMAAGAILGGCASGLPGLPSMDGEDPSAIDKLKQVTNEDLMAAKKMATDNGDIAGAACFGALADRLHRQTQQAPQVKGVFSAYEMLRLGLHKPKDNLQDEVHIACAPLIVDAQRTMIRLGVIAGSGGAGGGGLSILKGAIPLLRQLRGVD